MSNPIETSNAIIRLNDALRGLACTVNQQTHLCICHADTNRKTDGCKPTPPSQISYLLEGPLSILRKGSFVISPSLSKDRQFLYATVSGLFGPSKQPINYLFRVPLNKENGKHRVAVQGSCPEVKTKEVRQTFGCGPDPLSNDGPFSLAGSVSLSNADVKILREWLSSRRTS